MLSNQNPGKNAGFMARDRETLKRFLAYGDLAKLVRRVSLFLLDGQRGKYGISPESAVYLAVTRPYFSDPSQAPGLCSQFRPKPKIAFRTRALRFTERRFGGYTDAGPF